MNIINKERNSSIELLRIVSMLLIVMFHFLSRNFNLYVISNEQINQPNLLSEIYLAQLGALGVPCFMFISGYFGIKFQLQRFNETLFQCLFYAIFSFVGYFIIAEKFEWQALLFTNYWWFMTSYLTIYILAPGINYLIENSSSKRILFILTFLYITLIFSLWRPASMVGGFITLVAIYIFARFCRLHLSNKVKEKSIYILLLLVSLKIILIFLSFKTIHLGTITYIGSYKNPLNILIVGLCVIIIEKKHFYSNLINKLAHSSLSVYLLSESAFGMIFFSPLFPKGQFNLGGFIIGSIIVFISIFIIDNIRLIISKRLFTNE